MEVLETPTSETITDEALWGEAPPPNIEEQEMSALAFHLWQRGSRQDPVAEQDCTNGEEEVVAPHASCL